MAAATDRPMAGFVTLLGAMAIALYLCWQMVQPFLNVILWAGVLAVVFFPLHKWLRARITSASTAAICSTLIVVLLILLPALAITAAVVREFANAAERLPQGLNTLSQSPLGTVLQWLAAQSGGYVNIDPTAAEQVVAERLQAWGTALAGSTLVVVGGVVGAVVQMVLVVFTLFYMFRDGDNIRHALYGMLPLQQVQMRDITVRTRDVIAATIYGVLVISAIQGTLGAFIFLVLGLPSPLLWGVVMFFLSMIPMAGAFLVWAPAALYLAVTGTYLKAAVMVAWGVLVIGAIDNVLSPRLVGRRARLHELLIFFAVLGGLEVFGILGLVLGPVTVALTLALIEMVRQAHRPPSETLPETTVLEQQAELRNAG
jgi:predicted PurR-regulated permease PerM